MARPNHTVDAAEIPFRERDLQLGLEHPNWPQEGCPLGDPAEGARRGAGAWERRDGYLRRRNFSEDDVVLELMLRFPNAPVYGLHERPERQPSISGRSNFHTFRVLGRAADFDRETDRRKNRIQHVYILHNGLNETRDFELHHHLAKELLHGDGPPAICIMRPFPAHLTRYPYSDMFAEKPLDTFLLDSGDLFRQFMRFMIETRWLLSILAPRVSYRVITGGKLVDCGQWDQSGPLAKRIVAEWNAMDEASPEDRRRARKEGEDPDVTWEPVSKMIDVTRNLLLGWEGIHGDQIPKREGSDKPAVHMVGYSLGGFLAQSAFFAWPYAISGSITLFGGGELRKLAPTAFAQPEEWQSVLHSLRYELDRAMTGPLIPVDGKIQGVNQEVFEYLRRVFYEVFLQYYQGSYRTRLAEFIQRMLFVTGGQDPIVKPHNVLDAAPKEGVNLINIAGMSHFPTKPKEPVQTQQRDFWLTQLGKIIPAFAEQADNRRLDVLNRSWLNDDGTALHPEALEAYQEYKEQLDGIGEARSAGTLSTGVPLSDRWFGKEIEQICEFIGSGSKGWVLVSRNEIPPVFQTEDVLRGYAAALHHSEDLAADEFFLACQRRDSLLAGRPRVTLMISDIALEIGFKEAPSVFPARSETPGVARLSQEQLTAAERYFEQNWEALEPSPVRVLDTGEFLPDQLGAIGKSVALLQDLGADPTTRINVRFLPDAWIGLESELLAELEAESSADGDADPRQAAELAIVSWGLGLAQERSGELADTTHQARLEKALENRALLIVEFSRAGLNPRYRGQRLTAPKRAAEVLIHWALAFEASGTKPYEKPETV